MSSRYDDLERPPLQIEPLRRALLTPGSLWSELEVVDSTPSTNALLVERAATDGRSGLVLVAEHQTAGRGRLDRSWDVPPRAGLTMSVLVRPYDVPVSRWPWIALLTGLAVGAALSSTAGVAAALKWPNDVVIGERKVAGILVERVEAGPYPPAAVIGIGLNVSLTEAELPVPTATSLLLEGAETTDRSVLVRAVLRTLEGLLGEWQRSGGAADHGLLAAYSQACGTVGRHVLVSLPGGDSVTGEAVGVDASGRLVVSTADGTRLFGAGDVVHLRPLGVTPF
jgi:BirA family transcriptional regulator, biotin operon repressor / biotin---[acetyl-CoA-carboxylase] ligase